ncbi:prolyl oligopeptidase family protein [Tenacibaculum adriaticum]|uniref:Prolyl oligopeptidase family protein n=1 Tax=Tenacibaculum adriaticum TaxID=413713 RepID=A0A5S5DPT9_9FLAO|nr:prolyl oligopeptidase family serine peptidase [Tenacibaculum adriaticum]TYP97911.1 prolyl oligopeptidase family protein [Tenacibaculum adriaticum]
MKLFKQIAKFIGVLFLFIGLITGTVIYSYIYIDKEIQTNTITETKAKFGSFKDSEIIKKEKLNGFKYWVLESSGIIFPKFKLLQNVDIYSIAYKSDGLIITGIMLTPKKEGIYPCIIYNRGGNRDAGRLNFRQIDKYMLPYANQGYVVIASNYRGNSGSEGKEEFGGADVNDVMNLIPVLSKTSMADISKIGIFGHSRGGLMTYKAIKNKNIFKTAVVMAGSANEFISIRDRPEMEQFVYSEVIPNYYENRDENLKDRSVVYWPEKLNKMPLLLLHGTKDKNVNYEEAKQLVTKLDSLEFPYKFVSFEGDDHVLNNNRKESVKIILDWFNKYLRNVEPYNETQKQIIINDKTVYK